MPSHLFALCLVHDAGRGGARLPAAPARARARATAPRRARRCSPGARSGATPCWRRALESFTDRTTVGPESLRRELARTVARGYSVEDREYEPDTRGLAAPVFSEHAARRWPRWPWSAPVERLQADRYGEVGAAVMSAAGGALAPSSATRPAWRRRRGRVPEARRRCPRRGARGRARDRLGNARWTSRSAARRPCATGRCGSTAGRRTRSS